MNIYSFLRRVFHRRPKPAPRVEYYAESSLPTDATTLIRAGVVKEWRIDHYGVRWYVADAGAVQWFTENLGGETDA